jgi:hypothetical protein
MLDIKKRPSDGMPDETENEEESPFEGNEDELESFLKQADEERKRREEENKQKADELRKMRESQKDKDEEEADEDRRKALKIELKKVYTVKKGVGVFDRKGKGAGFGTEKFDKKIEKSFKTGARRVSLEKQREFMQLFNKYHGFKRTNLSTVDKEEFIKFEAGLRKGSSDQKFSELCENLKKEGTIKNSADVKKFFTRRDLKTLRNSLTGQKTDSRYSRIERETPGGNTGSTNSTRPDSPFSR